MIEVFKTDVLNSADADRLVLLIMHAFPGSSINFDLDDCDNILRVKSNCESQDFNGVIEILAREGFSAFVLPGDVQTDHLSFESALCR